MKVNRYFALFSFLLVVLVSLGFVSASGDVNIDNDNLMSDPYSVDLSSDGLASSEIMTSDSNMSSEVLEKDLTEDMGSVGTELSSSNDNALSSEPKEIVVNIGDNYNEMNDKLIKNAIASANAGDTIIINGSYAVHCHLIINKRLTIKSVTATTLGPCSSSATSNHQGIFYITSAASGTVIEGFNFNDNQGVMTDREGYNILVKGASNVVIMNCNFTAESFADSIRLENANNCIIQNVDVTESVNGIKIKNSNGITVKNSLIRNSIYGINIIDSSDLRIDSNNITGNNIAGIAYSGTGSYLTVIYNNITDNGNGVNLTSSDNVYIQSNYISFNRHNGVYVDYNITKLEIKGNFFNQNHEFEVFDDYHVKNLDKRTGDKYQIITNNYMINYGPGDSSDLARPIWRQYYNYVGQGAGNYVYDAATDTYNYVGYGNGDYNGQQYTIYLGYIFAINEYLECPVIRYSYSASNTPWSQSGNYHLKLSEITQIRKGIYSISIVDENGNIASDISSVPITFYLNKVGTSSTPQEGDIYRTVMMKNGTATVRFYSDEFRETGNVITAVSPTPGANIDSDVAKTFTVSDDSIPGIISNTTISVSNVSTYPKSNKEFLATLNDENGNAIANQTLIFVINSKTYNETTDENGQAKIKIYETMEGTYVAVVSFLGDEIDYYSSSASSSIVVKKVVTKIISSNVYMIPKLAEYYSITLKDSSNKVIAGKKVTFRVNGKTYTRTTTSKGVAKVALKFTIEKTYKIAVKFAGDTQYKAISKTNNIVVKYSSKTAKLVTPTLTIPPKTAKLYTVTLKNDNGKGIANQKVIIKIDGKTYTKTTTSSGQVKVKVLFNSLKSYKVSASYGGSKIYKKVSSTGKVIVAKTATKITAPIVSTIPKVSKSYMVTLKTSAGKALSKQKLTIKVNGATYTKTTNAKGQASISVKLSSEKSYDVVVTYAGDNINKGSKATGKIVVSKIVTQIESYNRTFSNDSYHEYTISLKDNSGNALANQTLIYSINGMNFTKTTDANGQIRIPVGENSFEIVTNYAGNDKYKAAFKTNAITVLNKSGLVFVDNNLPNSEIQNILDSSDIGSDIEFLQGNYTNVALTINNALNVYSDGATLIAKSGSPAFTVKASSVNISNFKIVGALNDGILINGADNVNILGCTIFDGISDLEMKNYVENVSYLGYGILINSTNPLPGYGVHIVNSTDVNIVDNVISLFESGIFVEYSSGIVIDNNTLKENNYGIKYGFGVSYTEIINNIISDSIGLYTLDVPEGPSGYGIFLNNSAVNVTIAHNVIVNNHLGISLDANYSTGIVIIQNTISDNVLEGMRFNAGYDLAQNAIKPLVTDNAIYRNARGPSMMILGELSANPMGIYGNGLYDPKDKLPLDSNWYGTNTLVTWDNDTGVVGYGTMCPRINTTGIGFNATYSSGNCTAVFYKNGEMAINLPKFDMYATLNRGTDKQMEITFDVINGVGVFSFDAANYFDENNIIEISIGSLIDSTSRIFVPAYTLTV